MKEVFGLFDDNGDGSIETKDLGTLLRSIGFNPTDAELHDKVGELDPEGNGSIQFPQFFSCVTRLTLLNVSCAFLTHVCNSQENEGHRQRRGDCRGFPSL